ncbi:hypothetical protein [Nostoc sp. UHCC 0251]|uniref:hypothetical protein n=1 Tax=Nostoc sp. UHCC 0251 TaxID=3110240 RepID=UPI002B1F0A55|nr:hypothetical protein [Nostoc sp. UHCC 0251]MEA5624912.1 hypothetical protein [Nostoc sp. UHCC 0251]
MSDNTSQGSFWTTLPGILTGLAGVLGGILGIVQVFKPPSPPPGTQVPPLGQERVIEVDAKFIQGTAFTNSEDKPVRIKFQAEGKWSIIPTNVNGDNLPKGLISANGSGDFAANSNRLCPGFALGALVVRTKQGECITSGANGNFDLTSGQTVYFSANDVKRLYEDNDGSITVYLSTVN